MDEHGSEKIARLVLECRGILDGAGDLSGVVLVSSRALGAGPLARGVARHLEQGVCSSSLGMEPARLNPAMNETRKLPGVVFRRDNQGLPSVGLSLNHRDSESTARRAVATSSRPRMKHGSNTEFQ